MITAAGRSILRSLWIRHGGGQIPTVLRGGVPPRRGFDVAASPALVRACYGRGVLRTLLRAALRQTQQPLCLTSSHFHHHNGDHDCGGVTYDRVACKHASSYLTPEDLDRYELAEAFALPPPPSAPRRACTRSRPSKRCSIPPTNLSAQWPLELTVHELLLYPPHATEGRAPRRLDSPTSTVDTQLRLPGGRVLLSVLLFALVCVGSLLAALLV